MNASKICDTHKAHKLLLIRKHILIIFAYISQLKSFQMYEYHKHTNQSCRLSIKLQVSRGCFAYAMCRKDKM